MHSIKAHLIIHTSAPLMTNYKVEDGFDFYAAIGSGEDDLKDDPEAKCLLSSTPLDYTAVSLPCGHRFNYVPLYKEVVQQKKWASSLETVKLGYSQFKCPYCRTVHSRLLPFVELEGVCCIRGINTISDNALNLYPCDWTIKVGKRKGELCGRRCRALSEQGRSCTIHAGRKRKPQCAVRVCTATLKSGSRKGQECGARIHSQEAQVSRCKRHTPKN